MVPGAPGVERPPIELFIVLLFWSSCKRVSDNGSEQTDGWYFRRKVRHKTFLSNG